MDQPGPPFAEHVSTGPLPAYEALFPYYAELCALSELRKKPGFGARLQSGMGGHLLLYLNGVRVRREAGYPLLECGGPADGAAISVNSHYRNANWVAVEDRHFVFHGALQPAERLTREAYVHTQELARARGLLEGIAFHAHFFKDKPAGMSDEAFKYEISVATDYAACFGRDVFRTRVPLDAARMALLVDYLNSLNAPYRSGAKIYNWRLFNDNCAHVAHNALAAAGVWAPWPTGQLAALAMFRFPVPKNELVDLAMRGNELSLDAETLFADAPARDSLMRHGTLPVGPGALTSVARAVAANDIYDVETLRLIFYDNPFWGAYRGRFRRLFSAAQTTDLAANLRHFAGRYREAAQISPALHLPASFRAAYRAHIATQAARLERFA